MARLGGAAVPGRSGRPARRLPGAGTFSLDRHGEFYPFGVSIDHDGEATCTHPTPTRSPPTARRCLDTLVDGLIGRWALIRAAAWVADIRLADEPADAICVTLEHADAVAMTVVLALHQDDTIT
ncbi:MAG: hypothetical protein M3R09_00180 [Actinomycetota bacterium]|nr:hypothetical protein [Actinomycetota bacterium]